MLREAEDKRDDGLFEQALQAADHGLMLDPESPALMRCKARTLMFLKRDDEAVRILDSLLAQKPNDWMAHFHFARHLAHQLFSTEGEKIYNPPDIRKVRAEAPIDKQLLQYQLHRDAVARLNPDSAELYCLLAQEETDPNRAIDLLAKAIERKPRMEQAWGDRARRFRQFENFQMMLLDAERLVGLRPNWAAAHGLLGVALSHLGRNAEAERAYTDAIRLSPGWAVWWHNRSDVKNLTGRFSEALADSNEAIRRDESSPDLFIGRAHAFAGLGRAENAMSDIRQAIRLRPDDVDASLELGKLLFETGKIEEAKHECTRLIALKPDEPRAYCNRAAVFIMQKEFERAIDDLTECIRLAPSHVRAYSYRGQARASLGQRAAAIDDFTRVIQLEPNALGDLVDRANLFLDTAQYDRAIDDLTELLNRGTDPETIRLKRGMAYELAGATRLALADYEQAVAKKGSVGRYARLWRYLALLLLGESDSLSAGPGEPEKDWIDKLYRFLRGELRPEQLLAEAESDDERAEAHYYMGMKALIEGKSSEARSALSECVKFGRNGVMETHLARGRLKALDAGDYRPARLSSEKSILTP